MHLVELFISENLYFATNYTTLFFLEQKLLLFVDSAAAILVAILDLRTCDMHNFEYQI